MLMEKQEHEVWRQLHARALEKLHPRAVSPFIEAGGVASAILTDQGNIYVGVCIDTSCSLGMCAERNAIANMITNGESKIVKLICVMRDGSIGSPCGACREYLLQLHQTSGEIEILTNLEGSCSIKLKELFPDWWGYNQFNKTCR